MIKRLFLSKTSSLFPQRFCLLELEKGLLLYGAIKCQNKWERIHEKVLQNLNVYISFLFTIMSSFFRTTSNWLAVLGQHLRKAQVSNAFLGVPVTKHQASNEGSGRRHSTPPFLSKLLTKVWKCAGVNVSQPKSVNSSKRTDFQYGFVLICANVNFSSALCPFTKSLTLRGLSSSSLEDASSRFSVSESNSLSIKKADFFFLTHLFELRINLLYYIIILLYMLDRFPQSSVPLLNF